MPRFRRPVERARFFDGPAGKEPREEQQMRTSFVHDRWPGEPGVLEGTLDTAGRLLMSGMFVSGGWQAFREPKGRAKRAEAIGIPFPVLATRLNGGAMLVSGVALAAGVAVKPAAAVLAASLVPTTIAGHPFWREEDPKTRAQQRIHFLKNLAMLGGLLVLLSKRR
jgi:putative oxidoreductase